MHFMTSSQNTFLAMESMCRRWHRCGSQVQVSHQLSCWRTGCCRWGPAPPLSPIKSWAIFWRNTWPKIHSHPVTVEPSAPCWYIAVQRCLIPPVWEESNVSGKCKVVSEKTSAREISKNRCSQKRNMPFLLKGLLEYLNTVLHGERNEC